jgi:hypothetical protein
MDCPRCGGSLTHYQLADAETVACGDCTYVGVPVDHTSEQTHHESWTEALNRFHQEHSAEQDKDTAPFSAAVIPVFEAANGDNESDDPGDAAEAEPT